MTEQREIVFLDELEKQLECSPKEVLSFGISGKIGIYSIIKSCCTGYVYGRGPTDEGHSHEGRFECVYKLSRADLISLRTSIESKVSVSFRYERNFDPTGESIKTNSMFDLQTDFDGWDYLVCDGEISMSSLFSHDDEKLRSVSNKEGNISTWGSIEELPRELKLAISIYYEFWHEKPEKLSSPTKNSIELFLNSEKLSVAAINRIIIISKPEDARKGGAPSTESKRYKGKSSRRK